ncbi:MAG: putative DNA repair protein MutK [Candidatus Endobugula sp.]|jgi:predicted DNA repair protein MutK
MATHGLLLLIDDIAALLDDVAVLAKVAAKKTAGVLGDDLALNAQQVSDIKADRELPVIWAVAKGSFINKLILVPAALVISAFIPWLIIPLLIVGGLFLCYEGIEKILHHLLHPDGNKEHHADLKNAIQKPDIDILEFEKKKIKGAIRTDFILSAEIIAITLGVVANAPFATQAGVLSIIAVLITIIVYGLVAGIVRLDNWGLFLFSCKGTSFITGLQRGLGIALLQTAPYLMKGLSIFGTAAMFLVGGGILSHGIPFLHHLSVSLTESANTFHSIITLITPFLFDAVIGIVAGLLVFIVVDKIIKKGVKELTKN